MDDDFSWNSWVKNFLVSTGYTTHERGKDMGRFSIESLETVSSNTNPYVRWRLEIDKVTNDLWVVGNDYRVLIVDSESGKLRKPSIGTKCLENMGLTPNLVGQLFEDPSLSY